MPQISFVSTAAKLWRLFCILSQPSSVSIHPRESLKNSELSRYASIIYGLISARTMVSGVSVTSGIGTQATQTLPENTTMRRTIASFIVRIYLQCRLHSRHRSRGAQCSMPQTHAQKSKCNPVQVLSIIYIILSTCFDLSQVQSKGLSPRFVRHDLIPLVCANICVEK